MNGRIVHLRRYPRLWRNWRGAALLEVALAMALMSMCGLGLLSAQLGLARHALASAVRARAAFAADALAEAALEAGMAPRDQWKTRAAAILPEGRATVNGTAGSVSLVVLTWAAQHDEAVPRALQPDSGCEEGAVAAVGRGCVALAFTQ
jgi:Tfp pilus assembly protein PilV